MGNSKGIESLKKVIAESVLAIEVVNPIVVSATGCEGKLCAPEGWFFQIEKCGLCGRLS